MSNAKPHFKGLPQDSLKAILFEREKQLLIIEVAIEVTKIKLRELKSDRSSALQRINTVKHWIK